MDDAKRTRSFLEAINKYAERQRQEAQKEITELKKEELAKITEESINEAEALIQNEISKVKTEISKEYAKRETESKKQLFEKRHKMVNEIFNCVKQKLVEYTDTEQYIQGLIKSSYDIINFFNDNSCVLYISVRDKGNINKILTEIKGNFTVETDEMIKIGGVKGYCPALNIIADETYDSKLSLEHGKFIESTSLKVV